MPVFGDADDRTDYNGIPGPRQSLCNSVGILIHQDDLVHDEKANTWSFKRVMPLGEFIEKKSSMKGTIPAKIDPGTIKFAQQRLPVGQPGSQHGVGTAFLVRSNLIATAGHVAEMLIGAASEWLFITGFVVDGAGAHETFPKAQVHRCTDISMYVLPYDKKVKDDAATNVEDFLKFKAEVLGAKEQPATSSDINDALSIEAAEKARTEQLQKLLYEGNADLALIKLEEDSNSHPLPLATADPHDGEELWMAHHSEALPLKYSTGKCRRTPPGAKPNTQSWLHNITSFHGSSGAPIFNQANQVVGIHGIGRQDLTVATKANPIVKGLFQPKESADPTQWSGANRTDHMRWLIDPTAKVTLRFVIEAEDESDETHCDVRAHLGYGDVLGTAANVASRTIATIDISDKLRSLHKTALEIGVVGFSIQSKGKELQRKIWGVSLLAEQQPAPAHNEAGRRFVRSSALNSFHTLQLDTENADDPETAILEAVVKKERVYDPWPSSLD